MKKRLFFLFFILFTATTFYMYAQDTQEAPKGRESVQDVDESKLLLDGGGDGQASGGTDVQAQTPQTRNGRISTFTAWDFIRMILILGAVIGLIYVISYFVKKRGAPSLQNNELFKILSSQAIASNRTLHLVQVGNQYFLVGAGEHAVNLISEIHDKETIDEIRLKMSNVGGSDKKSFRNIFSGLFGQPGAVKLDGSVNTGAEFLKKQRDRLKGM